MARRVTRHVSKEQVQAQSKTEAVSFGQVMTALLSGAPNDPVHHSPKSAPTGMSWRIEEMMAQLNVRSLRGPYICSGGRDLVYSDKEPNSKPLNSKVVSGSIEAEVCIFWRVNAGTRPATKIHVALDGTDTYSVRLWQASRMGSSDMKAGIVGKVLYEYNDVYSYQVASIAAKVYDDFVRDHMGGFIPS